MKKMRTFFLLLSFLFLNSQISFSTQIDTNHVFGLTIDGTSPLAQIDTSLAKLCKKATTRIVFDTWAPATDYVQAVNEINKFSFIMAEILDSYRFSTYTLQQFIDRTNEYYNAFSNKIDIWEIGNEINGSWNGPIDSTVLKTTAAYNIIKSHNKKTALTLFYCWDDQQHQMYYWVNHNLSASMRNGLDYVFVSYYEDDCGAYQPNWQRVFDSLHVMFPNAKLGIGECGTQTASKKVEYMNRYYRMNITTPGYVGGYFWWYWRQDCVPQTVTLWSTFNSAVSNYPAPLIQACQIISTPISSTSLSLSWTNGNGTKRVVFLKLLGSGTPVVSDGTTYIANTTYGLGSSDGTGWYCVYNGSGNNVTVTGITPLNLYNSMVLEYNGFSGFEGYNRSTSTNNPVIIQGTNPVELVSFTSIVERNNVKLKWTTNNEVNNKGFNIERTLKGNNENWISAGFVNGNGNINIPVNYVFVDKNIPVGSYKYRLKQTDYNGNFEYFNLSGVVVIGTPSKFGLSQNYPNPFNPTTNINFELPLDSKVAINVYDISGREVRTLINETKSAGYYTVMFDASNISSGVYFYKIRTKGYSEVKRMLLVK